MSDIYDNLNPVTDPVAYNVRNYYKQREAELREKLATAEKMHADEQDMRIAEEKLRRAAEARIKASQEQEPCAWAYGVSAGDMYGITMYKDNPGLEPLYAQPPIPPELAELQRDKETAMRLVTKTIAENESVKRENAELRNLLEESKVPEGSARAYLQDLVAALDSSFISSWQTTAGWQKQLDAARDYLAAAQSKEPKQ